jgi:hypothetical protein
MGTVAYMAATKVLVGLLGVALTFAPKAVYRVYIDQPEWWGLSDATDQAVGGLIMALEQSVVMGVALVYLMVRALEESEREEQRRERSSMTSKPVASCLPAGHLGVTKTHNRPYTSTDNANSEAVFKTLKYLLASLRAGLRSLFNV